MSKTKLLPAATHAGKIMGRHVVEEKHGSVLVDWPGVRLDFGGITGTSSLSIRMNGNLAVFGYRVVQAQQGGEQQQDVDDDENDALVILTSLTQADYPLSVLNPDASTTSTQLDPAKTYNVSVWKRDDPMNGGATILGLLVDEATGKGLHKHREDAKFQDTSKRPLLEFVGDSDTVGFGIRGNKTSVWYFILCQIWTTLFNPSIRKSTDVTKSWAHLVAHELNADYHVIALSGVGAKYNEGDIEDNMTTMYSRMLGTKSNSNVEAKDAAFLGPKPDAIVIYIGQNDESALSPINLDAKLEAAFTGLLMKIRAYRPPPIPIVIVTPSPEARLACQGSLKANHTTAVRQTKVWGQAMERLADEHIYIVETQHEPQIELNSPNEYGMCLHWNVSGNQKWAAGLTPKLKDVLKWNT